MNISNIFNIFAPLEGNKKIKKMSKSNNSKGFVYVLRTPSEEGWVYINASEEDPHKKCEELIANGLINNQFEVLVSVETPNPFKVFNVVETILEEYRVIEGKKLFKVDVPLVHALILSIDFRFSENFDESSTEGRYGLRSVLKDRPELSGKRFNTVEEMTSLGIDEKLIYDNRIGRLLIDTK